MGYSDTDVAEYLYTSKVDIKSFLNYVCKDLTKACSRKPPPVPKVCINKFYFWLILFLSCPNYLTPSYSSQIVNASKRWLIYKVGLQNFISSFLRIILGGG